MEVVKQEDLVAVLLVWFKQTRSQNALISRQTFNTRRRERLNINVSHYTFSYSRALGDRPRNFEPWSSDEDDTRAGTPIS
ncbi:hypothetical protein TNCV_889521 [Trichonephila clavipes]|nr:hypothetical protein TNCV_889521 [Trichonephila clavipes]